MNTRTINFIINDAHKSGKYAYLVIENNKMRIIRAKSIKGNVFVKILNSGAWHKVNKEHTIDVN